MLGMRRTLEKGTKVMWLIIFLSVTLLMPLCVSGKYRSEFSSTVDIVVYPAVTAEGIPEDGTLINDSDKMYDSELSQATHSGAGTPSGATYSQADRVTFSQIDSSERMENVLSTQSEPTYPNY